MHILLVYQYYHNLDCSATGRHYQLARSLSKHHRITILTSDIWERKRQTHQFEWAPEGTTIHSFPVEYDNAMNLKGRLKAYSNFACQAVMKGLRIDRPDVIIGSSTPLTAAWAAAKIARLRHIPWIFEVRDLWPDFPIQMGAVRHQWLKNQLYRLEERLYDSAAHIVTLSPDMETHVRNKGISHEKVTTLLNGTDLDLVTAHAPHDLILLRKQHGLDDKKIILYAGTFGRANAIPSLIETARYLNHRSDLHFVFLGEGYYEPHLREASNNLSNLTVLPPQPRHAIFQWFRLASLSLVTFIDLPVLAANSPAKFFDSLAAGTPVLVTNPGWTKSFVERHQCGWYVSYNEPGSLVGCIERVIDAPDDLEQAGLRGQAIAQQCFDRTQMAQRLEDITISST